MNYKEGVHRIIPSCLASALNSFLGYYIITKRSFFRQEGQFL